MTTAAGGVAQAVRIAGGAVVDAMTDGVKRVQSLARPEPELSPEEFIARLHARTPEKLRADQVIYAEALGPLPTFVVSPHADRPFVALDSTKEPIPRLAELDLDSELSIDRDDFGPLILSASRAIRRSFVVDGPLLKKVDVLLRQSKNKIVRTIPFERGGLVDTNELRKAFSAFAEAFRAAVETRAVGGKNIDPNLAQYAEQLVAVAEGRGATIDTYIAPPKSGLATN